MRAVRYTIYPRSCTLPAPCSSIPKDPDIHSDVRVFGFFRPVTVPVYLMWSAGLSVQTENPCTQCACRGLCWSDRLAAGEFPRRCLYECDQFLVSQFGQVRVHGCRPRLRAAWR